MRSAAARRRRRSHHPDAGRLTGLLPPRPDKATGLNTLLLQERLGSSMRLPSTLPGVGHLCYVPSLGRVVGFSGNNIPATLYDPAKRTFQAVSGFVGRAPDGYTLRSAYDSRRDRILLVSWDRARMSGPSTSRRSGGATSVSAPAARPRLRLLGLRPIRGRTRGLWPDDPAGAFDDDSGKSRTFLVDLARTRTARSRPSRRLRTPG